MPLVLAPDDDRLAWPGAVSLERTDQWVKPWRIPHRQCDLFFPDGVGGHAAEPAGVRITFRSNTATVAGKTVTFQEQEPQQIDLCIDGELLETVDLSGQDGFRFAGLSVGEKNIELWLPQCGEFLLRQIEVDDRATVEPFEDHRPR